MIKKISLSDEEYTEVHKNTMKEFEKVTKKFLEIVEMKLNSLQVELIQNLISEKKYDIAFMRWLELIEELNIKLDEKEEIIVLDWYSLLGR